MKTFDWKTAILDVLAIDEGANQALLKHVHPKVWRAELPEGSGKKTIASTFAHIHNVRLMWLKMTGKRSGLPRTARPPSLHQEPGGAFARAQCRGPLPAHRFGPGAAGRPHRRVSPERHRLPLLPRLSRRSPPRSDLSPVAPARPSPSGRRRLRRLAVEQD